MPYGAAVTIPTITIPTITDDHSCFIWGRSHLLGLKPSGNAPVMIRASKSISIGHAHALIIDTNNDVYGIGANHSGELGTGDNTWKQSTWTRIKSSNFMEGEQALKTQCGDMCSAILTTMGVLTMGKYSGGRTPTRVVLNNVIDISLKWSHILALTSDGEVYAWRDNEYGACGVGQDSPYCTINSRYYIESLVKKPTRVPGLENFKVRQILAGYQYSTLLCKPQIQWH